MGSPFQILWRWVKRMRRGTALITLIWTLVDPPGTRHDRGRMSKSRVPVRERDHAQSRDVSAPVSTPPSLDKKQRTSANAPRTPPLLEHKSYFLLLGRLLFLYLCRLSNPHGLTREPLLFLSLEPHQANWSPSTELANPEIRRDSETSGGTHECPECFSLPTRTTTDVLPISVDLNPDPKSHGSWRTDGLYEKCCLLSPAKVPPPPGTEEHL